MKGMAKVELLFRHASFRPGQQRIVTDLWHAIKEGKHFLFNAPTGSGKTDSTISTALTYALDNDLDVFFLTPKTSQHEVAISVAAGIAEKFGLHFKAVDFVGKKSMCLNDRVRESGDFYHACARRCKARKCAFKNNLRNGFELTQIMGHAELLRHCSKERVCAYEAAARAASQARLVVADYYHLFAPPISTAFLRKTGKDVSKSIIVIDEAHNLPQRMRDYLGASVNEATFSKAGRESQLFDSGLARELGFLQKKFVQFQAVKLAVQPQKSIADAEKPERLEQRVDENEFIELLGGETAAALLAEALQKCGEQYVAREEKQRSACLQLSAFLTRWLEAGTEYCRVISADGLECKCLDATTVTGSADKAHSCIAMSGTLLPLEMYRDLIGLDASRTVLKEYACQFPPENRLNVVVDSVSTKYSRRTKEEYEKIAFILQNVHDALDGGRLALFFSSYKVMNAVLPLLHLKNAFVQREAMNAAETSELISSFKKERGTLCAVMGGSLAEGIDYAEKEIACACLVGIPLQEMSLEVQSLIEYYDQKFGRGWEYGYIYPAVNKALQAAGRGIRRESDKCAVLFMDERYLWKAYRKCLPKDFAFTRSNEPWKLLQPFLNGFNY